MFAWDDNVLFNLLSNFALNAKPKKQKKNKKNSEQKRTIMPEKIEIR